MLNILFRRFIGPIDPLRSRVQFDPEFWLSYPFLIAALVIALLGALICAALPRPLQKIVAVVPGSATLGLCAMAMLLAGFNPIPLLEAQLQDFWEA